MTITTDAAIDFFGTETQIDDGTTGTVADTAFSEPSSEWINVDDAPQAVFVLEFQFDSSIPTVGLVDLYARPLNIQSTSDASVPDTSNLNYYLGHFPIDFGESADTNFFASTGPVDLPNHYTSQVYEFYFHNNATGQTIGVDWNLWITPLTIGPHS